MWPPVDGGFGEFNELELEIISFLSLVRSTGANIGSG